MSPLCRLPDDASDPLYGRIRVIVMDTAPGRNHAVTSLRGRVRNPKKGDALLAFGLAAGHLPAHHVWVELMLPSSAGGVSSRAWSRLLVQCHDHSAATAPRSAQVHACWGAPGLTLHGGCAGDAFAAKAAAYLDVIDSPNSEPDPTPDAAEPDDLHNPGDR